MPTLKIISNLIDGSSTKKFRTIKATAKFVKEMEDFGEDGRRSWGFQGEFGMHEFSGFDWSDIHAVWNAEAKAVFEILDGQEWMLFWCGEQCFSQAWSVRVPYEPTAEEPGAELFMIQGIPSRFEVRLDIEDGYAVFGVYGSFSAAIDAIKRWAKLPLLSKGESLFDAIRQSAAFEFNVVSSGEVPF